MNTAVTPDDDALDVLAAELGSVLLERGWHLACAESCTGGWISQAVTAIAGSSAWFEAGLATYSNAAKVGLLGVNPMIIEKHGAVSEQTAIAMAAGARRVTGVEISIAVTGVAGPDGGTPDKPVGTVWMGLAVEGRGEQATLHRFPGNRRAVRAHTVATALATLIDAAS